MSVRLDVAAAGIDLGLDAPSKAGVLEEPREFEGTIELIEASSEKLMPFGAEGGVKDPLSAGCEGFKDMIEVLHGVSPVRLSRSTASAVGRSG
jgi:hypothetical protein